MANYMEYLGKKHIKRGHSKFQFFLNVMSEIFMLPFETAFQVQGKPFP